MDPVTQYKQRVADAAFKLLAGVEPTEDDLNALEQQHQQAWAQQIEDQEDGS